MQNNIIENLFMEWGVAQRQISSRDQTIKAHVLDNLMLKPAADIAAVPKFNFAWLSLALVGFAVLTFFIIPTYKTDRTFIGKKAISPAASPLLGLSSQSSIASNAHQGLPNMLQSDSGNTRSVTWPEPPVLGQTTPSSDNREFLKTNYSAGIQTRNVQNLSDQIQTDIRGFGGRVDSNSSSAQSGYISFVVPSSQFETFKQQIKALVNYRFYSETTDSQNLLPQKVDIENQQSQTNTTLAQLNSNKDQLTKTHNQTVASLKSQIKTAQTQATDLQNQTTTDPSPALQIETQKQDLAKQIQNLQNSLSAENYNYSDRLGVLNAQITDAQNNLASLTTQTNNLLDNVATVNGSITLNYISPWRTFNIYVSPGYWAPGLLLVLALLVYWISRRQTQFIIP